MAVFFIVIKLPDGAFAEEAVLFALTPPRQKPVQLNIVSHDLI